MKKKVRKIIDIIMLVLTITTVGILVGKYIYENSHIKFADEMMGEVLCNTIRGNCITTENVTRKDLKEISNLEIGFSGYYNTLKDIRYCTGLEDLSINWKPGEYDPAFAINQGKAEGKLSEKGMEEVQKELGIILPRLSKLKILWLSDFGGEKWTSLKFLENCDQIEELRLSRFRVKDYSALQGCTSLTRLSISDSEISKAEDIIGLENLKFITFYDTPLAEKPEEIKKLQEAYPDAEIRWERKE